MAHRLRARDGQTIEVRDVPGFIDFMRFFMNRHCFTCNQIVQLVEILPATAARQRVELCVMSWGKVVDRTFNFSDVVRAVLPMEQVRC